MKNKFPFIMYGVMTGALAAIFGSLIYGPLALLILVWITGISANPMEVGYAGLYSVMFSILPGILCGAYLAYWLANAERTPREVTRYGLIVGAVAGALSCAAVTALLLNFLVDIYVMGFFLFAIALAAGMGALGAKFLARKWATEVATTTTKPTFVG